MSNLSVLVKEEIQSDELRMKVGIDSIMKLRTGRVVLWMGVDTESAIEQRVVDKVTLPTEKMTSDA